MPSQASAGPPPGASGRATRRLCLSCQAGAGAGSSLRWWSPRDEPGHRPPPRRGRDRAAWGRRPGGDGPVVIGPQAVEIGTDVTFRPGLRQHATKRASRLRPLKKDLAAPFEPRGLLVFRRNARDRGSKRMERCHAACDGRIRSRGGGYARGVRRRQLPIHIGARRLEIRMSRRHRVFLFFGPAPSLSGVAAVSARRRQSSWRARLTRLITVPFGTPRMSANSA